MDDFLPFCIFLQSSVQYYYYQRIHRFQRRGLVLKYILRFTYFFVFGFFCSTCNNNSTQEQNTNSHFPQSVSWGVVSSTNQLVTESSSSSTCPSGWSKLFEQLHQKENGHIVPLQTNYVKRFSSLTAFSSAAKTAFTTIGPHIPTIRISLSWPCFVNSVWRKDMALAIEKLRLAGFIIEITLSHHDSYPGILHKTGGTSIASSGWAHPEAKSVFLAYVHDVIRLFTPILPAGTRVYLINEPVSMLFNSYLGNGNWPPGGKRAVSGFYTAMITMRDTLHEAGLLIQQAQWEPAIAKNIRINKKEETLDPILDYIFNWWILDALLHNCIDTVFSGDCTSSFLQTAPFTLGITYYGTIKNSTESITLKPTPSRSIIMPLPVMDFSPNPEYFSKTVKLALDKYPLTTITIAEVGLSSGNTQKAQEWLFDYSNVVQKETAVNFEKYIGIHTLFESAEFSSGEWFFHILNGCDTNTPCVLTPWGNVLLNHIDSL